MFIISGILIYLFFGIVAVYLIEKMLKKQIGWEFRILTSLTGYYGFFITLVIYILFKAINPKNNESGN